MEIAAGTLILFILTVLFGLVVTSLLCFFLLVMHEYGHVVGMMRHGIQVEHVVIGWPTVFKVRIGGLSHHFGLLPLFGYVYSPAILKADFRTRAAIAMAGPIASVLLGLFLLLCLSFSPHNWLLSMAAWGSLILAGLNLVPLPPCDGWHAARYWLFKRGITPSNEMEHTLFVAGIAFIWITVLFASLLDLSP